MNTADLLLQEFNEEAQKTRKTLERVPQDKRSFAPHAKSMPLERLAALVAQLPEFGAMVLTTPELEFGQGTFTPLKFESPSQLARAFDDGAAKLRTALQNTKESAWAEPWKLSLRGTVLFQGSRFMGYRQMFLNHLVHHRAQLGVYLRMNGLSVPAIYGPSADEA
ncbi:MAG TPA: DinB family protein [Terriglobales bacterium]|nr:DinB family protein [Terriglobales bacterium]